MVSEVDGSVHVTTTSLLPCVKLTLIESGQPITLGAWWSSAVCIKMIKRETGVHLFKYDKFLKVSRAD